MSAFRTPLRYPGGKQRLAPFILELLAENGGLGGHYVEPYAGGAGVALELLLNHHVNHIHLNDSSVPIYAFWHSVIHEPERLCRLVTSASITVDEWKMRREVVRHPEQHETLELGFSTLFLNRCNRSGILSGGLIGGLKQDGPWKMDARFRRDELIRRIEAIASRHADVTVTNYDAETFILEHVPHLPENTFVYCDPPYFEKSNRLYLNSYGVEDHARVARVIQQELHRLWVVSYDNAPQILDYYSNRQSFQYEISYNASSVYTGKEVIIFSDNLRIPAHSSLPCIDAGLQHRFADTNMR